MIESIIETLNRVTVSGKDNLSRLLAAICALEELKRKEVEDNGER